MSPGSHSCRDSDLESVTSTKEFATKLRRYSTGPKYPCSLVGCGAIFKRLDHLDRHEFHHTGIKKHACIYEGCTKTYSIVTHLKRHLRTTHERTVPPDKNVCCAIEECKKMFQTTCSMQRHVREVHENPKVYHCAHCGETFKQKLKMRRHEIIKHTGEFPFSCQKCAKGFYQQQQCERHTVNCKTYSCLSCGLEFDKWSKYMKHCKETQHGRKYYKCEHCAKTYVKPGELKHHVAAKHLNDGEQNNFECTQPGCERIYAYERNLRQHMQIAHSGKRFACEQPSCSSVFSSGQNLTKHMQRQHNLETLSKSVQQREAVEGTSLHKKARRKRKDAGKSTMSSLAKLSGLSVEKDLDRLLMQRDENAINIVTASLGRESDEEESVTNKKVRGDKEDDDLQSLLAIALNEQYV